MMSCNSSALEASSVPADWYPSIFFSDFLFFLHLYLFLWWDVWGVNFFFFGSCVTPSRTECKSMYWNQFVLLLYWIIGDAWKFPLNYMYSYVCRGYRATNDDCEWSLMTIISSVFNDTDACICDNLTNILTVIHST